MSNVNNNYMSKIFINKNNQATTTIPKHLIEAAGWKNGTEIRWEILGKDKFKVEKIRGEV